jgi:hypothetical protein
MKNTIIVILICLTIISCTSEKKPIPVIDLKNNQKTKVIKLSDMISRINVVSLETSDNILLGQYTQHLVSDRFIVTMSYTHKHT